MKKYMQNQRDIENAFWASGGIMKWATLITLDISTLITLTSTQSERQDLDQSTNPHLQKT